VDVVFDQYLGHSIKNETREKRTEKKSRPVCRIVDSLNVPLPGNWINFPDLPDNKSNLSEYLSEELIEKGETMETCELITGGGFKKIDMTKSTSHQDVTNLKATHEEADTRIILHA
jgi:hypothetical protein